MRKKLRADGDLGTAILIYEKQDHNINNNLIDKDALGIIKKIQEKGGEAYLVGGAVRDLLLDKKPKDFDITTNFTPYELRSKFKNTKIIGNRFKLVHFIFSDKKYIEVATFRSTDIKDGNNKFGNIEEDSLRRDFSVNALYYDPISSKLYDYVGGYDDLTKKGKLVPIIDKESIFKEDPVRMIRAIKYSIKDNLSIDQELYLKIIESAPLIANISVSRLYEELVKIYMSGNSYEIFKGLTSVNVLNYILPKISYDIKSENPVLISNLKFFDTIVDNFESDKNKIIELGIYSSIAHIFNKIRIDSPEKKELVKADLAKKIRTIFVHFNISKASIDNVVKLLIKRNSFFLETDSFINRLKGDSKND